MIDSHGYRPNIGIIIINNEGKLFWGKRIKQDAWQFPQGGVDEGESAFAAMYRELYEEVGLLPKHVEVMDITPWWLRYSLPMCYKRSWRSKFMGQKQKWVLLKLIAPDEAICLKPDVDHKPEFRDWKWIDYWQPVKEVIYFKKEVYSKALEYFYPLVEKL